MLAPQQVPAPPGPAFGYAPTGIMQFNTGVQQKPSITGQQRAALTGIYAGLGQKGMDAAPGASPSVGGEGGEPQAKAANDAYKTLSQQQGAQRKNAFQNQVNVHEADLAQRQNQAQSQATNAAEGQLANQYGDYVGALGEGNTAAAANVARTRQLQYGLLNSIFGGMLNSFMPSGAAAAGGTGLGGISAGSFGTGFGPIG
jgi:hypothetical protein